LKSRIRRFRAGFNPADDLDMFPKQAPREFLTPAARQLGLVV
jgi:hypothetical protein